MERTIRSRQFLSVGYPHEESPACAVRVAPGSHATSKLLSRYRLSPARAAQCASLWSKVFLERARTFVWFSEQLHAIFPCRLANAADTTVGGPPDRMRSMCT